MEFISPLAAYTGPGGVKKLQEELAAKYPVYFSNLVGVDYDSKTDRYVGKFYSAVEKKSTVKLSTDVAEFLLKNAAKRGCVYLKLEKGEAVDCAFYSYES